MVIYGGVYLDSFTFLGYDTVLFIDRLDRSFPYHNNAFI